ncbi:MAG: MFS transporter [Pseudomonadota bacterium]
MTLTQKSLFLIFVLSNIIRTSITCFALDQLIKIIGADKLGFYYGYSALISIATILTLIYFSKKLSTLNRFISLHVLFVIVAAVCLAAHKDTLQAQLVFLCLMGLGILIYFNNWALAASFITPFESKRLFPWMGAATEIGVFLGALFAIASHFGLGKTHYYTAWLVGELLVLAVGIYLVALSKTEAVQKAEQHRGEEGVSLFQLLHHYKLVPRLTLWVFLWGLIFYSFWTLAGTTFDKSGVNLTALYGIITLCTAVLSSFLSAAVYPRIVRWLRLGSVLFASSIIASAIGGVYLARDFFALAIVVVVVFDLIDGSFVTVALSTVFGLYPSTQRDRIRLMAEILAMPVGTACVGLVFIIPSPFVLWVFGGLSIGFVLVGYISREGYVREVLRFLYSKVAEEQDNAIALFDMLEEKDGYDRFIDLLINDETALEKRISILNTFASLGSTKPAPTVLNLLDTTNIDPLKIAILNYVKAIDFRGLDPFLQFQLLENLKRTCSSKASNVLRSMAVKLLILNGSFEMTVDFITNALKDKDDRTVANAIEGLNYVDYPGVVSILIPFLRHRVPRIRANCIIALWKYPEVRDDVGKSLHDMLHSKSIGKVISGVYAAGEVQDTSQIDFLRKLLSSKRKELQRGVPIALLKLGYEDVYQQIVDMILSEDKAQAVNVCYLSLRLQPHILNESIIAHIYRSGKKQRDLAMLRYSRCGGFCRDQLELLSGKRFILKRR